MDTEIQVQLLRKILQPGDAVSYLGSENIKVDSEFLEFAKIWYGRLANPGCEPGYYLDRNQVHLKDGCRVPTKDLIFKDSNLLEARKQALPINWEQINLEEDKISLSLPATQFIESDIVTLIDTKHPNYIETNSKNSTKNQYTVYRIYYDEAAKGEPRYRLRAGKTQFDATEKQLQLAADGPIRIFYASETSMQQLHWRSLKDEAEFYLLLGRYTRLFNKDAISYKWILPEAKKMIIDGKGDGILKFQNFYNVVTFLDRHIGDQIKCDPELILDI